ncbi:MAG TPA: hypothetical protein VN856_17535 [Mycobacterium sp.]|jgi:hypothetical protein|uniref:hypothetical protein n=1 Tax=Mycobacterium sp. TaxID=1785 RepID=UPI002BCE993C|nr:hypothetical protein [Mycobacterium sp.]HXO81679.1 hypothetical protein [Mycobacterium sp.]
MSGAYGGGTRDRDTIERELRLLVSVRSAYRERGGAMPSIDQMDALLDELIELGGRGKHRLESEDSDAWPSLWR